MSAQQENRRWHLDRSINLNGLLATLTLAVAGAFYIMGMQTQIELGREQNKYMQEQLKQVQLVLGEGNGPLRRDIDRIQNDVTQVRDKLDTLARDLLGDRRQTKAR